jgi:hypothetical protein
MDRFSDLDTVVVIADAAVGRYYDSTGWLAPAGELFCVGRYEYPYEKLLELCFSGIRCVDVAIIPESSFLTPPPEWDMSPFSQKTITIFSRYPDTDVLVEKIGSLPEEKRGDPGTGGEYSEYFWSRAVLAVKKTMRNNLLAAANYTYSLAHQCLHLQIVKRNEHEGTGYHRIHGWGNGILDEIGRLECTNSPGAMLDTVERLCRAYDVLAAERFPGYRKRAGEFSVYIAEARAQATKDG